MTNKNEKEIYKDSDNCEAGVGNYGKQREVDLREKLENSGVDEVDNYIDELRETANSNDLRFIDVFDQVLRAKIDDHKYVRVYMIPLSEPMFITHIDVGMMDRYYLDSREDVESVVMNTVSNLADSDSAIKIERNKFDPIIDSVVIENV
jgi:hypothetical protein